MRAKCAILGTFAVLAASQAQAAVLVYNNTFDTPATAASGVTAVLVGSNTATSPSGEMFSGNGNAGDGGGYRNELVTLTLSGLQPGSAVTSSILLYVGGSADGNNGPGNGPDGFEFGISGTDQVNATFSNVTFGGFEQSYSDATPLGGGPFAPYTDADATNHLGYSANCCGTFQDSDYILTGSGVANGSGQVVLTFQAAFTGGDDDSVGFDNIVVNGTVVPEPASCLVLAVGSMGLLCRGRRTR
jgi:hypothetical protein